MDVATALTKINYEYRGQDADAPTFGDAEATYWLSILNRKKDELFRDIAKNWTQSFETRSLGTVTASTIPSYNLPTDFLAPAGNDSGVALYVIEGDVRTDLELVKPQELKKGVQQAYISGRNPQVLTFSQEIESTDTIVDGTLYITGYFLPADMTASDDTLPFPDPQWGVMSVAAELAFTDIVYEDRAEGLNNKANNIYMQMVNNAMRGVHGAPREVTYNVKRLGMSG